METNQRSIKGQGRGPRVTVNIILGLPTTACRRIRLSISSLCVFCLCFLLLFYVIPVSHFCCDLAVCRSPSHYTPMGRGDSVVSSVPCRGGDVGGTGGPAPPKFEVGDCPCIGPPQYFEK